MNPEFDHVEELAADIAEIDWEFWTFEDEDEKWDVEGEFARFDDVNEYKPDGDDADYGWDDGCYDD